MTPPKGKSLPIDQHELVLEIIGNLLTVCHIIYLGEVSSSDLECISQRLKGTPFIVMDMTRGGQSSKFNLGVIYNEDVANFIGNEFKISKIGGDNYKISCRFDFVLYNEDYFSFLVSHWPSRLLKRDDSEIRGHYGAALRTEVESIQNGGIRYLVVMGDFNDEPFNHSLTTYLRGCRDASFVKSHPDLLYNPFWRQIVCTKGYVKTSVTSTPTGTYFYKNDNLHRWRVFDQMLFSSSFVGLSDWHINEDKTGVLRYEKLLMAIESSKSQLDHLPIIAELNKEIHND